MAACYGKGLPRRKQLERVIAKKAAVSIVLARRVIKELERTRFMLIDRTP